MLFSVMLYSSIDQESDATMQMDSNSYLAFKVVDSVIVRKIRDELDALMDDEEEGMHRDLPLRCFSRPH